jgi:hypothetical protein
MPGMRIPDGGDPPRMAAVREPAFQFAADGAAWCFVGAAGLSGDQQDNPRTHCHRPVERARQVRVRAGEAVAVKVDGHINVNPSGSDSAIPACIEGLRRG